MALLGGGLRRRRSDGGCRSDGRRGAGTSVAGAGTVTDEAIAPERCEANKAAGTITYLSSFDFAASPSIVDVVDGRQEGLLRRHVPRRGLKSSFSTANYPLVAANQAQFSSAGSYTEMLTLRQGRRPVVAVVDYGKSNISALLVRDDGTINQLDRPRGQDHRREGRAATVAQGAS